MPYKIKGRVEYDPPRPGLTKKIDWWCIAHVDRELTRYMRWWINKELINPLNIEQVGSLKTYPYVNLCQPSWDAHVSILRGAGEWGPSRQPKDWQRKLWKKYDGMSFDIYYDFNVKMLRDKPDFWCMTVDAPDLIEIRKELGLKHDWPLHLTCARTWIFGDKDD